MGTSTLYEGNHPNRQDNSSGIALCRITAVDTANRLCTIKTFFGTGAMDDNHIPNCQWLSQDANPEGDESTSIPRIDSIALAFFVNGEVFVMGFLKALTGEGSATTGNEVTKLTSGDKLIATVGGNRISVKANGSIELRSKETLRTIYFPTDSLLNHLCKAYLLQTDGGYHDWKKNDLGFTTSKQEYRADLLRTGVMIVERGYVDATTIERITIGVPLPGGEDIPLPSFQKTIGRLGEVNLKIGAPGFIAGQGFEANILPTGAFDLAVNSSLLKIEGNALGGFTVQNEAGATVDMGATGEITVKNKAATISVSATGAVEIDTSLGDAKIKAKKVDIEATSDITVKTLTGKATVEALEAIISAKTGVKIDGSGGGGSGAVQSVLTNPATLSPFTGAPLVPFSQTVKVSP